MFLFQPRWSLSSPPELKFRATTGMAISCGRHHRSCSSGGFFSCHSFAHINKKECIPVGCVPSATVAVCWGVCLSAFWDPQTRHPLRTRQPPLGPDTPQDQAPPRPGTPSGTRLPLGPGPPQDQVSPGTRHPPGPGTPPRGQTDKYKNITFATSLQTVTKNWVSYRRNESQQGPSAELR